MWWSFLLGVSLAGEGTKPEGALPAAPTPVSRTRLDGDLVVLGDDILLPDPVCDTLKAHAALWADCLAGGDELLVMVSVSQEIVQRLEVGRLEAHQQSRRACLERLEGQTLPGAAHGTTRCRLSRTQQGGHAEGAGGQPRP